MVTLYMAPDVEISIGTAPSGLLQGDLQPMYRGPQGWREFWELWTDAWDDYQIAPQEIIDLGDRLVVFTRQVGRGKGSGIKVEQSWVNVSTYRRGRVAQMMFFPNESDASAALGIDITRRPGADT